MATPIPTHSLSSPQNDPVKPARKEYSSTMKTATGATTAAVELLTLGHVLDRIKTTQQASPNQYSSFTAAKYIYEKKGLSGFYTGLRWNLVSHSGKAAFR